MEINCKMYENSYCYNFGRPFYLHLSDCKRVVLVFYLEFLVHYITFFCTGLIPGKDNGVTSSSDGRILQGTPSNVSSPAAFPGLLPSIKLQHSFAAAFPQMPVERDSSHDSMVSSTSNLPSSSESQGSDAASVLLYHSSNSSKDPRLWNVQEVTNFMYSIGCSNYADAFIKEVCISCSQ